MKQIMGPNPARQNLAYQLLNGFIELELGKMPPPHKRMEIDSLVAKIYRHRIKLCARAGLDFEDEDIEAIASTYEQLNRLCADFMYNQGWHDASQGL